MSASLVGSEMCIRDRPSSTPAPCLPSLGMLLPACCARGSAPSPLLPALHGHRSASSKQSMPASAPSAAATRTSPSLWR
eukprot:6684166-Alexandrium_andersonii.AAC.1